MSGAQVAVVGAGVAGLSCARALQQAGLGVTLFDKGRAAGGRVSTRRREPHRFDHGAQFFTARDPRFGAVVDGLVARGVVAGWRGPFRTLGGAGRVGDDPRPGARRFVGVPGMSALPRALADGLDVRASARVEALVASADGWRLRVADVGDGRVDEHGPFDRLVLALPPRQADALLAGAGVDGPVAGAARRLRDALRPCLCAMVAFDRPVDGADGGWFVADDEALAWAAHDGGKPGRGGAATYVLHATAPWSERHFERDPADSAAALLAAFAAALGRELPAPVHVAGHRWGFALQRDDADAAATPPFLLDVGRGLALAGDALTAGRVEGAWVSGAELAAAMLA